MSISPEQRQSLRQQLPKHEGRWLDELTYEYHDGSATRVRVFHPRNPNSMWYDDFAVPTPTSN